MGYDRDLDRAHDVLDEETVRFVADWQGIDGASARGDYVGELPGIVRPVLEWKTETPA